MQCWLQPWDVLFRDNNNGLTYYHLSLERMILFFNMPHEYQITSNEKWISTMIFVLTTTGSHIAHKIKFFINDFFSKYDQIHSFLRIWSHLLKKSFVKIFIFRAVLMFESIKVYNLSKVAIIGLWLEHMIQSPNSFSNCIQYRICVMEGM